MTRLPLVPRCDGTGGRSNLGRSSVMRHSGILHRMWGHHENRRPGQAAPWRRSLTLEMLEDRTVPATLPVIGAAPAIDSMASMTSAMAAPAASPAASPAAISAASTVTDVSTALQKLTTDLTATIQS